eukprot:TRINITY_DN4722_c0_g1_i1.p1 TRINITY_DN4722_c0_g1~~TRINITY_DN4722_c0_g1_i1.p1  ORF type:complete len:533 (+),score=207.08 TRINITY_DN4722_c0_g1_i1:85-1683(+)
MSDREKLLDGDVQYEDEREDATSKRRIRLFIGSSIFLVVLMLFIFTVIIAIVTPIALNIVNQNVAQNILNSASITFHSMNLTNPTFNSWMVTSNVTMYQTGAIAGTVAATQVLASYKGEPFATMDLPEIQMLPNNHPLTFIQVANMTIFNNRVYQAQAFQVISGNPVYLFFEGNLTVTATQMGLTMSFDVYLAKEVYIPAGAPKNIIAYDVVATNGTDTVLTNIVTQSLENTGIISVTGMDRVYLETWTLDGKYKIGDCIIDDFHMYTGLNVDGGIVSTMNKTAENAHIIEQILSDYSMGKDTQMRIRGPVKTIPERPFLYDVSDLVVTLKGNPVNQLIYNVKLAVPSFNPVETLFNPLNLNITQNNVVFDVKQLPFDGNKYLAFDFTYKGTSMSCPTSDNVGTLAQMNNTIIEANSTAQMTLISQSMQSPCEAFLAVAACCYLDKNSPHSMSFMTSTSGTFDISIQNFTYTQTYSQEGFPTLCVGLKASWDATCRTLKMNTCLNAQKGVYCNQPYFPAPTAADLGLDEIEM